MATQVVAAEKAAPGVDQEVVAAVEVKADQAAEADQVEAAEVKVVQVVAPDLAEAEVAEVVPVEAGKFVIVMFDFICLAHKAGHIYLPLG